MRYAYHPVLYKILLCITIIHQMSIIFAMLPFGSISFLTSWGAFNDFRRKILDETSSGYYCYLNGKTNEMFKFVSNFLYITKSKTIRLLAKNTI